MRARLLPLSGGVPVDPDAAEAQRWAEEELAKPAYDAEPGILERLWGWLMELLERIAGLGVETPPSTVPVILISAFVLVIVLALLLGGRVRGRQRAPAAAGSHQLFDDARSAKELHAAADAAAGRGDWSTAVVERFRALIRSLDERAVLEDRSGMTAHEAAGLAGSALPGHAQDLACAGRIFDDVCYSDHQAGPEDDAWLTDLAATVARARPMRPEERRPAGAGWSL